MGFYTFPISAILKKKKILKTLIPQSKIILNDLLGAGTSYNMNMHSIQLFTLRTVFIALLK